MSVNPAVEMSGPGGIANRILSAEDVRLHSKKPAFQNATPIEIIRITTNPVGHLRIVWGNDDTCPKTCSNSKRF